GIVAAAEQTGRPVILQAGSSAFAHAGRRPLAILALELAHASSAAVGVHLDHSRDPDEVAACLDLGYTSVMIDGSRMSFDDNVAITRQVVERARDTGAWVEAELGAVAGHEDLSIDTAEGGKGAGADGPTVAGAPVLGDGMTDPEQAAAFVAATRVDALAVAIGNVHGLAGGVPHLDLERLEALRAAVDVPLVLHGASGVPSEVLAACAQRGVAKVNVNTELRLAFLTALRAALPAAFEQIDLAGPLAAGRDAVIDAAGRILRVLAGEAPVPASASASASEELGGSAGPESTGRGRE
ncbi:MAG TPA: class II fructose-bisphosphate aldolase, partial [Acidimicrobiales bacterium]|nr:class II fructose-bisphosphate aldolase [Acidimicrobiales bacterium]